MSVRRTIQAFETWRELGQALVLATVFETRGSTYSKAGHRILIAANGDYQGLVSGGCLEGDLAERARGVLETSVPAAVTYDMRDEADDLWGLGIGCNGLIRVFLQPLLRETSYEPFASLARRLLRTGRGAAATVIASGRSDLPPGATLIRDGDTSDPLMCGELGPESRVAAVLSAGCLRALESGRAEYVPDDAGLSVLYTPLEPVPRLLVLGAGLDAIPIVNLAADLGWFVTVADHRPAYLERGGFSRADAVVAIEPPALREQVPLDEFDAVLVMSHHLVTDRIYLSQLVDAAARYVGVLGPAARRARLLEALGEAGETLRPRVKGPVGLDLGADSPESIALSIVAELQGVFSRAAREARRSP